MADNKQEILKALCQEGVKLGLTVTEFWRQVRLNPISDENMEEAAEETLAELRAGGVPCTKCDGSGEFHFTSGPRAGEIGPCYRCKGKGFENRSDIRRNFGHRKHNPQRHHINRVEAQ